MKFDIGFGLGRGACCCALSIGLFCSLFACNRSAPPDASAAPAEPAAAAAKPVANTPAAPAPAAAAGGLVSLDKLGLKAEAPAGSTAGPAIIGEGVMIQGPDLVVTIEPAGKSRPKTAKDAQKEAADYKPQNVVAETLADGWVLTFQNIGGAGANYFVQGRREIGKKSYWCETTASSPTQQANALKACKSLTL